MLGLGLLLTMRIVLRVLDQLVMLSVLLICKRNLLAMILVFSMSFLRGEVSKYANRAATVPGQNLAMLQHVNVWISSKAELGLFDLEYDN